MKGFMMQRVSGLMMGLMMQRVRGLGVQDERCSALWVNGRLDDAERERAYEGLDDFRQALGNMM